MSVRLDHGEDTLDEVHEINVTPFIDVMLVLLIIFMVAAPLATVDIAVNLPASTARAAAAAGQADLPYREGRPDAGARRDAGSARPARLRARRRRQGREGHAHLPACRQGVPYGEMMEVMNLMRKAGFLKIALVGLEKAGLIGTDDSARCRAG